MPYIDKEKVLNRLKYLSYIASEPPMDYDDKVKLKLLHMLQKEFAEMPTADVEEVRHGEWIVCEDESQICATEFSCSVCKESFCSSELTDEQMFEMLKYCPNCGADMRGAKDE